MEKNIRLVIMLRKFKINFPYMVKLKTIIASIKFDFF